MPASGSIALLRLPAGPGVRVDHALYEGVPVSIEYDPLLAKIIAWGADRRESLARARRAVRETIVAGVPTSLSFHAQVLDEADFIAGRYDTGYVAAHWPPRDGPELDDGEALAGALVAVLASRARTVRHAATANGTPWTVTAREDALR